MIKETIKTLAYSFPFFADGLFGEKDGLIPGAMVRMLGVGKDETIFSAGERPSHIYRLIEGEARLFFSAGEPERTASRRIEVNEVLGLSETILELPFGADAVALGKCTFETVRREEVLLILHQRADAGSRLAIALAANIEKSYKLLL